MGISLDKSGAGVSIVLANTIDIACAAELKALLLEALNSGAEVRISLGDAIDLDVTAIQLLWAAEREAQHSGVGFRLSARGSEPVFAGLAEAGFQSFSAWAHADECTGCKVVVHS
jgi:anti-anti-sigma regulatory factor